MNKIINKFLSLRLKRFKVIRISYSACEKFTKNKERIQRFKETVDTRYIYKKEIDKVCFQHDMTYVGFKDLPRRTTSDKVLLEKAFTIAKIPKYDGYQRDLDSMVYKFFDNKSSSGSCRMMIQDTMKVNLLSLKGSLES